MTLMLQPDECTPCHFCSAPAMAIVMHNHVAVLVCDSCLVSSPTAQTAPNSQEQS